jgi:ATP-dependent helicase/nuclease subunit A
MSLTPEQQTAAYTPSSVVVTAGAGTGKTHLLTARYLYYLKERGLSPLEIVAVTFTEKAAKELKSRIRSLITQQLPNRDDIIAELEAAPISTIHGLASRICQEHSEITGIPANFTVLEDARGKIWLNNSLDAALATLPSQCYRDIPYSLMKQSIAELLSDPYTAQKALQQGIQDWSKLITIARKAGLTQLVNSCIWQDTQEILNNNVGKSGDNLETIRQEVIAAMQEIAAAENIAAALTVIDKIDTRKGSKNNWTDIKLVRETLKNLRELTREVSKKGLINAELTAADTRLQQILPALTEAYRDVINYLNQLKYQARVLTFADLEIYALEALKHQEVREYYQQRWQVFLVDEFQDTNPTQGDLLERLTSNSELTIVGDIKQAIYGFRRADIQIFQQFHQKIVSSQGKEVILNTSFRTHQPLISQINQIFASLLGKNHQELVAFRQQQAAEDQITVKTIPYIQAFAVAAAKNSDKVQRQRIEADHLAQKLKQLLDSKTPVHDKSTGKLRPIEPGDILVLTRTWSPLTIYGEAISALGIPIAPAAGGNLLATREAKDSWSLLRFLADPQDDIALVAVLRSPWFAISDRIFFQVSQTFPHPSWWEAIQNTTFPELQYPITILRELLKQRDREAPSRLLQIGDRLTGYTAVIANLLEGTRRLADWKGFRKLVKELEIGTQDIFSVVRDLKQLYENDAAISRPPLDIANAVGLMTVYAAKGLERSLVVVADLNYQHQAAANSSIYFDPQWGVAVKNKNSQGEWEKPFLSRWLESQKQQQEAEEDLRILYVALTRARDYLILTANEPDKGYLAKLIPGLTAANIPLEIIPCDSTQAKPPTSTFPPLPDITPQLPITPVKSGIFELPVTALSEFARCPQRFHLHYLTGHPGATEGIAYSMEVGTLVHTALEHNIKQASRLLPFCDLTADTTVVTEAINLVDRFLQHPIYKPFRDSAIAKEKRITLKLGNITFTGVIDLLGKDWLLDYKSDRHIQPQHHRFQLWAYAQALDYTTAHIAYLRHDFIHTFSASDLPQIALEIPQLITQIETGNYEAKPAVENCAICPYLSICEFAK